VFESRLAQAGFQLEVIHTRAHGTSGRRHTLFLAG
jgi:hypothetical protein